MPRHGPLRSQARPRTIAGVNAAARQADRRTMASVRTMILVAATLTGVPTLAHAQAPASTTKPADNGDKPIRRFAPERNMIELGVFGGIFVFNRSQDLYNPSTTPAEPLR